MALFLFYAGCPNFESHFSFLCNGSLLNKSFGNLSKRIELFSGRPHFLLGLLGYFFGILLLNFN